MSTIHVHFQQTSSARMSWSAIFQDVHSATHSSKKKAFGDAQSIKVLAQLAAGNRSAPSKNAILSTARTQMRRQNPQSDCTFSMSSTLWLHISITVNAVLSAPSLLWRSISPCFFSPTLVSLALSVTPTIQCEWLITQLALQSSYSSDFLGGEPCKSQLANSRIAPLLRRTPPFSTRFRAKIQRHFGMKSIRSNPCACLVTACRCSHWFTFIGGTTPSKSCKALILHGVSVSPVLAYPPDNVLSTLVLHLIICKGSASPKTPPSMTCAPPLHGHGFVLVCKAPGPPDALF